LCILEEGDTTYFILDNVENEVVITDTPAVRCEQITNGEVMVRIQSELFLVLLFCILPFKTPYWRRGILIKTMYLMYFSAVHRINGLGAAMNCLSVNTTDKSTYHPSVG
jgi:hypothetical protein